MQTVLCLARTESDGTLANAAREALTAAQDGRQSIPCTESETPIY